MAWHNSLERPGTRRIAGLAIALFSAATLLLTAPSGVSQASEAILDQSDIASNPVRSDSAPLSLVGPSRIEPSSRGVSRSSNPDISTTERFILVVGEAAQDSQRTTGVPASVTVAQAILESDWGKSGLATRAFNLFGIKAQRGPGPAGVIKMDTWEVFGGSSVVVNDGFRAYHNLYESVEDHGLFLRNNARYGQAFKVTGDAKEFARRIHAAGYATDPGYSDKLIRIMDKYSLYRFDLGATG